ncbi:uncharacterized protein P174DRAFT_110252 [Aspergillus novofumigatus IBT 16806]|uniref:Uncharacterized protein n=1 Tax=Aspergillus novofumigatus (strain IBT 16806) TaxID=1392255 RepID=A0A2I1CIK3_ASPN1|nr:uncharacterized protein P174DRAFT_110252 [Aspergillus novofumigatus IBT 16806]PKX97430.1 hypothetical protein P174DRAFT_110252 [Aspergillus novofumigatus IBT 16806]
MIKAGNVYWRVTDLAALRYRLPVEALPSSTGGMCTSTHICIVKIAVTVLELFRFCESQYFHSGYQSCILVGLNTNEYVSHSAFQKRLRAKFRKGKFFSKYKKPQCRISVVLNPVCTPNKIEKSAFPEKATIIPLAKTAYEYNVKISHKSPKSRG